MLNGTVEVRKGPVTVVVMIDTRCILFSFVNLNAASSVKRLEST